MAARGGARHQGNTAPRSTVPAAFGRLLHTMSYRLLHCRLRDGTTKTATEALEMRDSTSRRAVRGVFLCPICGGDLVVHDTNPPHFEHARPTDDRPQPDDCPLRFVR